MSTENGTESIKQLLDDARKRLEEHEDVFQTYADLCAWKEDVVEPEENDDSILTREYMVDAIMAETGFIDFIENHATKI